MKKYFYSNGKEKQGPFSFEELKNKDIKKETLIWFHGLEDWKPAEEIKEIGEILKLIPPPIIVDGKKNKIQNNKTDEVIEGLNIDTDKKYDGRDEKKTVNENILYVAPHPWRRLFAREIDTYFGGLLMLFIFTYAVISLSPENVVGFDEFLGRNTFMGIIIMHLLWFPVEALFLSVAGTTPGKWAFGIRILSKAREKLSYLDALKRVFLVFFQGDGLSIPIIIFITRISAYGRLKKTGTTLWDTTIDSVVIYKKWNILRAIASIIIFIALLVLVIAIIIGYI